MCVAESNPGQGEEFDSEVLVDPGCKLLDPDTGNCTRWSPPEFTGVPPADLTCSPADREAYHSWWILEDTTRSYATSTCPMITMNAAAQRNVTR